MTSEHSLSDLASIAGVERQGGEQARAIDLPAQLGRLPTVFDTFPESIDAKRRKTWARKRLLKIRDGCADHHGVALDAYVEYLIDRGEEEIKNETTRHVDEFLAELNLKGASEAMRHAARCCALVYAGGMHGIAAGVLPFKEKRLKAAIHACSTAALKFAKEDTTLRDRGRDRLIAKLADAFPEGRKERSRDFKTLVRREVAGRTKFAISKGDFVKLFPNKAEAVASLLWLHETRRLMTVESARPVPGKFGWAITWPKDTNGKGQRRIVFWDPAG